MFSIEKRVFWPSFFICSGLIFCLSVSSSHDYLGLWLGVFLILIVWLVRRPFSVVTFSLPAIGIILLMLLIFNSITKSDFNNYPVIYFFLTYFFSGFFIISVLDKQQIQFVYYGIVIIFSILSCWAIVQFIFNYAQINYKGVAASVIFANPNTFAAALNLILLPLITIYLFSNKTELSKNYLCFILIFAGLVSTQSRAGWIAFVSGLVCLIILFRFVKNKIPLITWLKIFAGFLAVIFILYGTKAMIVSGPIEITQQPENNIQVLDNSINIAITNKGTRSIQQRIELAKTSLELIKEQPINGIGYFKFIYFYYENLRYTYTHYVHNDYLQYWLELGLPGILIVIFIIFTTYWQGIKYLKIKSSEEKIWVIAIISGLTSYFTHALASYVFYVPILLFIFAGYTAILNKVFVNNKELYSFNVNLNNILQVNFIRLFRILISISILIFLFNFVIAQISYRAGTSMLNAGLIDQASQLFERARRFSPAETQNYLLEADYWKNIALVKNDRKAANHADKLYKKIMDIDIYDVQSRLQRAILHREKSDLLDDTESEKTILSWFLSVLEWQPHHHTVQAEYIRTLVKFGKENQARLLLSNYLKMYPRSKVLNKVSYELSH